MSFSPFLGMACPGGGGEVQTELVHNLPTKFFIFDGSKIEVSQTYFFDIVISSNDHPRKVKHVLACIHVVFNLFWVW